MKPIQLTQEHKVKLLEMCNVLFPENKTWRFDQNSYTKILEYSIEGNIVKYIHWFEFCMTHLVGKVKNYNERNSDFIFKMNQEIEIGLNNNKVYKTDFINVTKTDCELKKCPCYSENPKWLYSKDEDGLNSEVAECNGETCLVTLNKFCLNHPIDYLFEEFKKLKL